MARRKLPPATKETASDSSQSKIKIGVIVGLFIMIAFGVLWSTGIFNKIQMGPRIPIMRQSGGFNLGDSYKDILVRYPNLNLSDLFIKYSATSLDVILEHHHDLKKKLPAMKAKLRPFNGDENFGIATLIPETGLTGAKSVDLIFFKGTLYFISSMWQGEEAKAIPIDEWVKQFRRWKKATDGKMETLGGNTSLREWHFNDLQTELVIRDLNYPREIKGKTETMVQRWQDIRDASNLPAQEAFQKYRLDNTN